MSQYDREGTPKTAEAVVIALYPDVCTKDGLNVPYRSWGSFKDLCFNEPPTVFYKNKPASKLRDYLSTSYNTPCDAKGVVSGTSQGPCAPTANTCSTVSIQGSEAGGHDTIYWMNNRNTLGTAVYTMSRPRF